jgi:CubicO group peptidase (beta-lactamase class C family)
MKNRTLLLLAVLALGVAACQEPPAAAVNDQGARVADLFAHLDAGKQPGAAVLVIKDSEVVFEQGFGYANLEEGEKITPSSSFRLASVSKQFTTAAIMVLAEEGKLDYDDLLVKHVPESRSSPPGPA